MKLGVLIPCLNVEKSIAEVLLSFSSEQLERIDTILLIDNASTDSTLEVLKGVLENNPELAKKLSLIRNLVNQGLGGSQKIGYNYFIDREFTHFFILHGDGQGDTRKITDRFLTLLDLKPELDLIPASRFMRTAQLKGYSLPRTVANHIFNFLTFVLSGIRQSDAGTGILLYRVEALKKFNFEELTNSFQFNPQLSLLLRDSGVKAEEVPLDWKDSKAGSNIQPLRYCWDLLKLLVYYRINKTIFRKEGVERFQKPRLGLLIPAHSHS